MKNLKCFRKKFKKKNTDASIMPFLVIAVILIFAGYYMTVNLQSNKITGFQVADSSESNPISLAFNDQVSGELTSGGTYYTFSGEVGGNYNIEVEAPGEDTLTRIYNCGDAVMIYPRCSNKATFTTSWVAQNNACLIRVYGSSLGTYKLKVTRTDIPSIQGSFSGRNNDCERPHYKFSVDSFKKYRIVYQGPVATLLGPNLNLILTPANEILFQSKTSINDIFTPSSSGYYYLKVTGAGDFTITISEETGSVKKKSGEQCSSDDECESNYCDPLMNCYANKGLTLKNPGEVSAGSIISGSLGGNEVAYYKFYPIANKDYIIKYSVPSSSAGVANLYILNKNKQVVVDVVGGKGDLKHAFKPTTSDVYYIAVRSGLDYSVTYSILPSLQEITWDVSVSPSDITFSNYNLVDQSIEVSVKVHNKGSLDADAAVYITVNSAKETYNTEQVGYLKAGEFFVYKFKHSLGEGENKFSVKVDIPHVTDQGLESNTANNYAEQKYYLKPVVRCGNNICEEGETYQNCWSDCKCGNNVCDAGETYQNCPSDCKCGNQICDSGETIQSCPTDCKSISILPDLSVINFYYSNDKPINGEALKIYATIANSGIVAVNNAEIDFTYEKDGGSENQIEPIQYINLNAGESKIVSTTLNVENGNYKFNVAIDPHKTITESNENNNLAEKSVTVIQKLLGVVEEKEICGDNLCVLPENCETCPQDCLTEGIEVCCDGLRTIGNCCSDEDCKAGEHCSATTCEAIVQSTTVQPLEVPKENCLDCIFTGNYNLNSPYELFRSDLNVFARGEISEGLESSTWGSQADIWANHAIDSINTADTLNNLGKIYEGLKLVKKVIELPKAIKDMVQGFKNLKDLSGAAGIVAHLEDFKKITEGVEKIESVAKDVNEGLGKDIGVKITDEDLAIADNSGKLIDMAITFRDQTYPDIEDVFKITEVTDLLFSGELAGKQADYYLQESAVAATLSTYASNLDKFASKQRDNTMTKNEFNAYLANLYAYSASMELYHTTKYARNSAYAKTLSAKPMTFVYCYITSIDIIDCYNNFERNVVDWDKKDAEKWHRASLSIKEFAAKNNIKVEIV